MLALPAALAGMAAYNQFIVYKVVPDRDRPGKTNKFPIDVRTSHVHNAHDPAIWMPFELAAQWAAFMGPDYGVGFVFTDNDPFWFFDADSAYKDGQWSALALQIFEQFAGCAVEISRSLEGFHIFGSGVLPPHTVKNTAFGLELYHRARFVALTGINAVGDCRAQARPEALDWLVRTFFAPDGMSAEAHDGSVMQRWSEALRVGRAPEWRGTDDDQDLIRRMMQSKPASAAFGDGVTFADLWHANVEALAARWPGDKTPYGESEADAALAQRLCFWTGKDPERIERLMRMSALARDKWDREDYLPRTILGAMSRQRDVLTDKTPEPVAGMPSPAAAGAAPMAQESQLLPTAHKGFEGSFYLNTEEQIEHFKGCVYVTDQHRVYVPNGEMYKENQFNVRFGGRVFTMGGDNQKTVDKAFEAFTQNKAYVCARADTSAFRPDLPPGAIVQEPGRSFVNTYVPINTPRQVGDITPFMSHLARVLPDERDRTILLSYMAAVVQYKGVKFQWCPVLQGVEGNGKTLFSRCVAYAVGPRYSYYPTALDLADKFNDWMLNTIFIGVEDIHVTHEKSDIMEALKPMVTNTDLQIQGKGEKKIKGVICCNWMINMNDQGGFPITDKSRRYAPLYCAQQHPDDLERDGMAGNYFPDLYRWLKAGGYAIVSELLHTYPIPPEFNPAGDCQRAPATSSTSLAIEASRSSVEQEILEAVAQGQVGFCGGWVSTTWLGHLLDRAGHKRMPHRKRAALLESLGYVKHPSLHDGRVDNVVMPDGGKPRLYALKGSAAEQFRGTPAQVAEIYSKAQEAKMPESQPR